MNRNTTLTLIIGMALLAFTTSCATTPQSPEPAVNTDWMFHDIVDAKFVAEHLSIPMQDGVMLIDARPKRGKYDKGHIPMAVSIPDSEFDKRVTELPMDKNTLLIYYCEGLACKLSHKSAKKAEALGYTNVKVFAEGYPKWVSLPGNYASVAAPWIQKQMGGTEPMMLVDSRPKKTKFDKGHIPGALNIPDSQFDKFKGLLPADKDMLLVFYCGGLKCKLSHKGADRAIAMGYSNVKVFSEGYPAYTAMLKAAGQPLPVATATAVKGGAEEGSIDNAEFTRIIKEEPESIYLVDVRDADEFSTGSFKTAVNIPVDSLESKIKTLPADKPIVFVCGTGARSGESFYMLQDLRPELKEVYYVEAEIAFKKDGSFTLTKPEN